MHFGPFSLDLERLKIQNLELDLNSKITHLWGKNGVGKSTLMDLLISELETHKISFCYINQNYRANWFWWLTVRQNLELAMKTNPYYHFKKIEEVPIYNSNKSWLDPLLAMDDRQVNFNQQNELEAISLSGGQLQRVLFFRELLLKPKFVFLDEAFSALDKNVALELIQWLLQMQQKDNFKIISIAHDSQIIDQMPGEILELTQTPDKILQIHKIKHI